MFEVGLFFLGACVGFLVRDILPRKISKSKGTLFVTVDHLNGLILPTPGSSVLFEDGGMITITTSIPPKERRYVPFTDHIQGPAVVGRSNKASSTGACDFIASPYTFWNSVSEINGNTVVRMPAIGVKI